MRKVDLKEKFRRAMAEVGKNYSSLAREVGCSPENIRKIVDSGTEPKFLLGIRLARALGVPADWLGDPEADWPPPKSQKQSVLDVVMKAVTQQGLAGELSEEERAMLAGFRCLSPTAQALVLGRVQGMVDAEVDRAQAGSATDQPGEARRDAAAALRAHLAEAAELFRAHGAKRRSSGKADRKAEAG